MRTLVLVACTVTLLGAAPAVAQRIGVVPFSGPAGANIRNQLVTAICDTADCVNTAKVTTGNKPDWKKAKKEALQFFVTGAIVKKGKAQTLNLEVLSKPGAPKMKKSFPLGVDGLSAKTLQQAIEALKGAFGGATAPPPPDETEPVAVTPTPTETKPAEPVKTEPKKEAPPPPPAEEEPKPAPAARRIPFIAVELGSDMLNRSFQYVQPVTNLRRYSLPFFGLAHAKLEFYPLALGRQDLLGGIGLEASFSIAAWLRSQRENSMDDPYPTSTMRLDAGLAWRIMPSSAVNLSIIPIVGVRYHTFVVNPNAAGTRLDLLPNLTYLGLRAGLGFELGLADDFIFLFGRFQAIPVFSSGEIISSAFFPKGSNFGLDGSAGIGIAFLKMLQLRLAFDFTRYGMIFTTEPTDAFVAQGATDQYIGGTASLRFTY